MDDYDWFIDLLLQILYAFFLLHKVATSHVAVVIKLTGKILREVATEFCISFPAAGGEAPQWALPQVWVGKPLHADRRLHEG